MPNHVNPEHSPLAVQGLKGKSAPCTPWWSLAYPHSKQPPTPYPTLHALATRVPPDRPCIISFPDVPLSTPSWNGRATLILKHADWNYSQITNALMEACQEGCTINIYCDDVIFNRNQNDGKQLGKASALLYHEGWKHRHAERVFGELVTESDVLTRSLTPRLNALTLFLATRSTTVKSKPTEFHVFWILKY
jgi:hypothetical protein